jgi:hypothetical protein
MGALGIEDDTVDFKTPSIDILTFGDPQEIPIICFAVSLTTPVSVSVLAPVPLVDNLKLVSIDSLQNAE